MGKISHSLALRIVYIIHTVHNTGFEYTFHPFIMCVREMRGFDSRVGFSFFSRTYTFVVVDILRVCVCV